MSSFLLTEANLNESEVPRVDVENLYILVCCRLRVLTTAGDTRWCLLSKKARYRLQKTDARTTCCSRMIKSIVWHVESKGNVGLDL